MIITERNGRIVHLKLNIPPVNIVDTAACRELTEKLKNAATDKTIAGVILSGEGKCFSAGASVEEHKKELASDMLGSLMEACQALYEMPVPTVVLVHGFCLGGSLELAAYGDFIIADPSARFGVPEINLAFLPPFACSVLPGIIGRQNAAHLIFTGETIHAERAHTIGLVQKIVEQSAWNDITRHFNKTSAPVLRLTKEALKIGLHTPVNESFVPLRDLFLKRLYDIEDVSEGISSFSEKRKPEWKHR